jgi:hypothetical protein
MQDGEWTEWESHWDIPLVDANPEEEWPLHSTTITAPSPVFTISQDMVQIMKEPAPKKKKLPKMDSGLGPQEVIKVLKAQVKALESNVQWYEAEQQKLNVMLREYMQGMDKLQHENKILRNKALDSDKLRDRILMLSKQLKIPVGNSNHTETMVNDFIGQAWIRIKTQDGVDELAD